MIWKPVRVTTVMLAVLLLATSCSGSSGSAGRPEPLRVGAIYPLSGSQGPGGIEEYRGVELAARMANQRGGVAGRPIELVPQDVPEADAAPAAVERLASQGIGVMLGSYGSTISEPAAQTASRGGQVFWETGAVGELMGLPAGGDRVFRVAPAGSLLGRTAMDFTASELLPRLKRKATGLRYTVAAVDDQFGDGVARGAVAELRARGLTVAGDLRYDPRRDPAAGVVRRIAGNAYRIQFSYQPSGKPVTALAGQATISLIFPLLPIPVSSPFDHTVLSSTDGRAWTKQPSTATPGAHQVAATLPAPGYVIAAVPPAPAEQAAPNRTPLYAGLAAAAVVVAVAAIVLARRLRAVPEGGYDDDDDYDDDYDDDEEDDSEDPDPGTEGRR